MTLAPGTGRLPALRACGPLAALTLAVLAGHLVLLQQAPAWREPPGAGGGRTWQTRQVVLNRPAAPPAPAAPTETHAAPSPSPTPRPAATPRKAAKALQPDAAASSQPIFGPAPTEPAPFIAGPANAEPTGSATPPAPAAEAAAAPPEPPPPAPLAIAGSVRLLYDVTGEARRQTYSARAELTWLQDGRSYDARLEIGAFLLGTRRQTSTGRIDAGGLAPTRFADKFRSEVAAHFERDEGRVRFSANTPDAPLAPGAQDRLSAVLQLAALLAGDASRYPPGATISLPVVGPRDADTWAFTVEGEESLNLPAGAFEALRLQRVPRREYDQRIDLWFAPRLGYLPVRLRIVQANGDVVDQQLRGVEKP